MQWKLFVDFVLLWCKKWFQGIQKDSAIKEVEDTTDQHTLNDGPAAIYEGSADDFVKFSPKVAKEMLDIEILELCKNGNFDTALRMVQSASSR